ncbi:MAG TPA: FAD-dependent oxidoreductase [Saprospiraceae bacterium]|nr:FAD-dependent oxidoreductase [Saprospiraceae bacterium]
MKDVVIIGGGAVGLWCAWHLHQAGRQVTIVDKGDFTDGCSFGNAGMIVPSHFIPMASPGIISKGIQWMFKKDSPFYIRPRFNIELAQWLWSFYRSSTKKHVAESVALLRDLHTESRELYRQLNQSTDFNFGFEQKGILMLFKSAAAEHDELEMAEAAHQLGIDAIHLTPEKLKQLEPGIQMDVRGAVHYPGDAHITPQVFMHQMLHHLKQEGVVFLRGKEITGIHDHGHTGAEVSTADGDILRARHIVVAAGSWSGKLLKKRGYRLPMQDGKGYSMTLERPSLKPSIPSILHEARVAITPMGDDLRISGTLEISGMDDQINPHKVNSILKAVPEYYPGMKIRDAGAVWFGYRPCTPDGMPYIGPLQSGSAVIMATGHAMMGLSLAPVTGRIVKDMLAGISSGHALNKTEPSRFR